MVPDHSNGPFEVHEMCKAIPIFAWFAAVAIPNRFLHSLLKTSQNQPLSYVKLKRAWPTIAHSFWTAKRRHIFFETLLLLFIHRLFTLKRWCRNDFHFDGQCLCTNRIFKKPLWKFVHYQIVADNKFEIFSVRKKN